VGKLSLEQRFEYQGKGPLDLLAVPVTAEVSEKALSEVGLAWHSAAPGTDALVCSMPERAMLELCDSVSDAAGVYEADALMQAMSTLRPQRVGLLLRHCRSIKTKRLFLALAERHRHAWLSHVRLLFLPPYSPELNPIEHVWDELREKYFHNRVFSSLEEVKQHLLEALVAFERSSERIRSICAWSWIINSVSNAN